MFTLGINAAFHDSAACLVEDGRVVAAAEEERFSRIKHGKRPIPFSTWELPYHAIAFCLRQGGIGLAEVDHVAYAFDPWRRLGPRRGDETIALPLEPSAQPTPQEWEAAWDPLFLASIVNAPRHLAGGAPLHLRQRFAGVTTAGPYRWHWVDHHLAHAASAFLPSPFETAAVLTLDGRGERATTAYFVGRGTCLERIGQVEMPHSLGILYEQVTEHLGFLHAADEYKVMALASFGEPAYADEIRSRIRLDGDGAYTIEPPRLAERFGPARARGAPLEQCHCDLARSLQVVLEETVLRLAEWLHRRTGERDLCLAGGVALNCVLNARLRDDGPFDRIWVQPAAGDAGTALGAALWIDARERRSDERAYRMDDVYLGPAFDDDEIGQLLGWTGVAGRRTDDIASETAAVLAANRIVGWFQGRMEFGPRALGARSIFASPLDATTQARLNEIKDREDFRPVAPAVLEEAAHDWFVGADVSPFMLFVHDVRPDRADRIPAVRHVDGTARIQTVNRAHNPRFHALLTAFGARTGVPVLVNTSFNTRGEPIVCTP
ncbi:MAG TPA: carbamoyltransferase C-terminal domain-containing protein, partial [Thermomicrobiales bacterium]|nr:carbamoyltransferase C-terminal domain-containing protein [Thermomicrobiales bacterium]